MRRGLAVVLVLATAAMAAAGCHTARMLAPPPPLRAASAAGYAVDVEFAEPLTRASAEDVTRYTIVPVAPPATPVVIQSATLVDTLYGRVVQLIVPDWLSTNPDTAEFDLTTTGVLDAYDHSTGTRRVRFRTGLSYRAPIRALLDDRCVSCHGPSQASGSYRVDSYDALFGGGANATPNLIAGDASCRLVVKCKPGNSMFNLGGLTFFDYELLRNWVVSYSARL